jgi:nucleoside-diphosphate-sugar epimerase
MNRILMTGAAGYVGHRLARRLAGDGIAVTAVLRPGSDRSRLAKVPGLTVREHDGDLDALVAILAAAKPEAVFHLAGKYMREHARADIAGLVRDNILFGVELLEAMRAAGVNRLVHAATYFQHMDGSAYRPLNLYAATKQAFEDMLSYYTAMHGFSAATLVLYDVYGGGDWRRRLIPAVLAALRSGEAMPIPSDDLALDLVHVDDVIEAFMVAAHLLIENPDQVAGRRFAVAPERRCTLREVLAAFERSAGKPVPIKKGAWPAPAHTLTAPWQGPPVPGWQSKIPLDEGIRRLLAEA